MAESIGDFFVNFFFKTDKGSAAVADKTLQTLKTKYEGLTNSAFKFNEITSALSKVLAPVKAVAASILHVGEQADQMNDFAKSVGTSVEALERMQYVGQLTGTSAEGVAQGMKMLSRQLHGAADGKDEAIKTFKDLGIAFKDSHGHMREVGQVMPDVIAKIAALPTDGQKAKAAMDAFGKAGLDLLPMLKKTQGELAAMGTEFDALGGGFNQEFVDTAEAFGDNMDRSRQILSNMRREIASAVLPVVNRLLERFVEWGKSNWPDIKAALNSFGDLLSKIFQNTAVDAIDSFLKVTQQLFNDKEKWEDLVKTFKLIGLALGAWAIFSDPKMALMTAFVGYIIDLVGMTQGKDSIFGRMTLEIRDFFDELSKTYPMVKKIVDYVSYLNKLGQMDHTQARESGAGMAEFIAGKTINTMGGQTLQDAGNQQLDIEKRKVLEGMDPFRGKAAMDLGLMKAKTGADVDRIANMANSIVINVQGAPGMDPKEIAHEVKRQFDKRVGELVSNAHDNLVTEGQ